MRLVRADKEQALYLSVRLLSCKDEMSREELEYLAWALMIENQALPGGISRAGLSRYRRMMPKADKAVIEVSKPRIVEG